MACSVNSIELSLCSDSTIQHIRLYVNKENKICISKTNIVDCNLRTFTTYCKVLWETYRYNMIRLSYIMAGTTITNRYTVSKLKEWYIAETNEDDFDYEIAIDYFIDSYMTTLFEQMKYTVAKVKVDKLLEGKECCVLNIPLTNDNSVVISCGHILSREALKKMTKRQCPVCRNDDNALITCSVIDALERGQHIYF